VTGGYLKQSATDDSGSVKKAKPRKKRAERDEDDGHEIRFSPSFPEGMDRRMFDTTASAGFVFLNRLVIYDASLSLHARMVYVLLLELSGSRTGVGSEVQVCVDVMAAILSTSEALVDNALVALCQRGLIKYVDGRSDRCELVQLEEVYSTEDEEFLHERRTKTAVIERSKRLAGS